MICHKFESVISDLARQQMMETGVRAEALEHCAECPACAKRLDEQRALTNALRGLAQKMESVELQQSLPELLTVTLRTRSAIVPPAVRNYSLRYWLTAVAAALLISLAIGAAVLRQQRNTPSNNPASQVTQSVKDEQQPAPVKTEAPVQTPEKKKSQKRRTDRSNSESKPIRPSDREGVASNSTTNSTTADANTEIATEFLPLGYGNALNLQDGGQIVRVEVPRSTLAKFGLPVNMNRATERVKADLLVGVDGSARAIRFVQ
jgi:hypothetical protein